MKKVLAVLMAVMMLVCFASCGADEEKAVDYAASVEGAYVVAEAGSAGEELANGDEFFAGANFTPVDSMTAALMQVKALTADVALVDYVASIGSIGEGTDFADLEVVAGKDFSPEQYGIAFRKNSDITPAVNQAIAELLSEGTLNEIGAKYKLDEILVTDAVAEEDADMVEGDLAYIKEKGELVIGITYFAPMNYEDENGELIGFETEFAKAVCEKLGVKAKFVEINWNSKEIELNAKNIDCIWNGMTITEERAANMSISVPYMQNKQVMVARKSK